MKVEIIVEKNFLEDILLILKNIGALKNTIVGNVDLRISGAFPHLNKAKLVTTCNEQQRKAIISRIFPIINRYGGACIVLNDL